MPAFNLTEGAAYIVITAITGTIYTLLAWCIRLFIRLKTNKPFSWDDIHCTIATLFTVLSACLVLSQAGYGLGQHSETISPQAAHTQRILSWLSVLCYIQAACFSILSITFLLVRVTKLTSQARPAYLVAFVTGLWCLVATTIIAFQCRLPAPWKTRPHSRCVNIYAAWAFITISRSVLEASNVAIAAWLLWKLHYDHHFVLRLLVIPPTITRLAYIKVSWQAADWSYARINVQIITQVALHVSTILATIPCVKNFLLVFESGNLHPVTQPTHESRRVSKRRSSIYQLRPVPSPPRTARPGALDASRRAKSEFDFRQAPTAMRPGPVHTLRMNSWSAPGILSASGTFGSPIGVGAGLSRSISTAEHDPEDAKSASLERRKSVDSEDSRKRIKRTQSFVVQLQKAAIEEDEGGIARREQTGRPMPQRQRSVVSCWSFDERVQVREYEEV